MEGKIMLDRKAFRSLASKTRINILRGLDNRRKTASELSRRFGMPVSTVKRHLDDLAGAGLVVRKDGDRKRKYYELTGKGRNILHPGETRAWIILGLSALAILLTGYNFMQKIFTYSSLAGTGTTQSIMKAPLEEGADTVMSLLFRTAYLDITGLVLFSVIFGTALGYIIAVKRSTDLIL